MRAVLPVAVQKMAEAHMQHLGVYPPVEDPCEGEEDGDHWQGEEGEDTSPIDAAGERETLCQRAAAATLSTQEATRTTRVLKCPTGSCCIKNTSLPHTNDNLYAVHAVHMSI